MGSRHLKFFLSWFTSRFCRGTKLWNEFCLLHSAEEMSSLMPHLWCPAWVFWKAFAPHSLKTAKRGSERRQVELRGRAELVTTVGVHIKVSFFCTCSRHVPCNHRKRLVQQLKCLKVDQSTWLLMSTEELVDVDVDDDVLICYGWWRDKLHLP